MTRNSEYHCRDARCVVVRDRGTGQLRRQHEAVGLQVTGGILYDRDGSIARVSPPHDLIEGERLCFSALGSKHLHDVITSPLVEIQRPPKDVVAQYDAVA
ncbi:MAG: hypothetical protein ABSE49_00350 [Polyangiaceae bacterium]